MRTFMVTVSALAFSLVTATSASAKGGAPPNPFGLGLMVGAPTGLSGKLYLGNRTALAMGVGESYGNHDGFRDDGLHLHVDFLWHQALLAQTKDFTLPLHVGVGGRILDHDDNYCIQQGNDFVCFDYEDDTHVGVRMPIGLTMDFHNVPLDIFLELALTVDFLHIDENDQHDHDFMDLTGAFGGRYYF
jgi:hypothetical protein